MVTGIYGAQAQNSISSIEGAQGIKSFYTATRPQRTKDTYVPDTGGEAVQEKRSSKKLTDEQACSLAKKYDVKNMTRNEYGNLLQELRNSGVISSQDFSVGFGGAVPYEAPDGVKMTMGAADQAGLDAWPSGMRKADFTKLLRACAKYCTEFVSRQEEDTAEKKVGDSLSESYARLSEVFEQIQKAAESIAQPPRGHSQGDACNEQRNQGQGRW